MLRNRLQRTLCRSLGSIPKPPASSINSSAKKSSSSSSKGSPFDSSFSFQLFLIVGAMGAGYTLGKTSITNDPPATLFPKGSTTSVKDLSGFVDDLNYDRFKRCVLRILEQKGITVDVKYGENESLLENDFFNREIGALMNEKDGLGDVFFGKDEKVYKDKSFVWYVQNVDDIALIMQMANEFSVPVFTQTGNQGLCFVLDCSRFEDASRGSFGSTELDFSLDALELFLGKCGYNVGVNGLSSENVTQATGVLPDGQIVSCSQKDPLFPLLTNSQFSIITSATVTSDANNEDTLVVLATNSTSDLNSTIAEVTSKLPRCAVSVVDSSANPQFSASWGDFTTFAIFKLCPKDLARLPKKFSQGHTTSESVIQTFRQGQIQRQLSGSRPDGILVTSNILQEAFVPLSKTPENQSSLVDDVRRRLKLALDSKLVLNRDPKQQ